MCAPRGSTKDPVFVLQTDQINVAEIQEISGLAVGSHLILGKFESDSGRVDVAFWRIVDRKRQEFRGAVFGMNRVAQIRGERGDAALPR